jgi:lysophospholipase L1-like esterase
MKLYTKLIVHPEENQIDYNSKVLLLGSCFTENIGKKLEFYKFQNLQNPFGILFHPRAMEKLITRALDTVPFSEEDIFLFNEQWHCFEVHSLVSGTEKETYLQLLNARLKTLGEYLLSASHILFTYGTAWVYRHLETDTLVANCHKVPQREFSRELLSVEEVSECISRITARIAENNAGISFIHTVSPVRHLKDGFIANSQSKSHLVAGVHRAIEGNGGASYFPSFEIVMDELRDYRFFKEDMLHPNETAVAIIWDRFKQAWIASETEPLQKEIEAIQAGLGHKPFHPSGDAHQQFREALQKKITALQKKLPHIRF